MARKYEAPIRVLDVGENPGRRSPYTVRWYVNGTSRWKSFKLKAPANDFYAKLIVAINARERFSDISGLPMSMETSGLTVASLCKQFVDKNRAVWEPKTRQSNCGPLSEMLGLLVSKTAPVRPASLNCDTLKWLADQGSMPKYLAKYSLPITDCTPVICADVFEQLCYKFAADGTRSKMYKAPATVIRYRRACRQMFEFVVTRELLTKNPFPSAKRGKTTRKERGTTALRLDLLPTHEQALEAISRVVSHQPMSHGYKLVIALVYYAGLRPGEARALTIEKCTLKKGEWGSAQIDVAAKTASSMYFADDSEKIGASKTDARIVSLHPQLVDMILEHIEDRTTGLVAGNKNGKPCNQSALDKAWRRARGEKIKWRIYDLRHAHASKCLRAGIPPVEVARSLGHSVEVLHRVYNRAFPHDQENAQRILQEAFESKAS